MNTKVNVAMGPRQHCYVNLNIILLCVTTKTFIFKQIISFMLSSKIVPQKGLKNIKYQCTTFFS